MKSITVEKLLGNNKNYQQVTGNEESLKRVILTGEINRPGFELAGFFKHSDFRRIIVFGDKEMAFIAEMTEERQKDSVHLRHCLQPDIPLDIPLPHQPGHNIHWTF